MIERRQTQGPFRSPEGEQRLGTGRASWSNKPLVRLMSLDEHGFESRATANRSMEVKLCPLPSFDAVSLCYSGVVDLHSIRTRKMHQPP